jgi:hypothetical protein
MTYKFYPLREEIRHLLLFVFLVFVVLSMPVTGAHIIVDHNSVAEYDQIPQSFVDEVKNMLLNYPGESHGRALFYGLELLEQQDSRFAISSTMFGAPEEALAGQHLRVFRAHWTGTGWDNYGGEEDTFTSQTAINMINNHLVYCKNTLNNNIDAFAFGWCWDMTWHNGPGGGIDPVYQVRWAGSSVGGPEGDLRWGLDDGDTALTGNSVNMQTYLNALNNYEQNNPDTTIIYSTGPVDGGSNTGESGYQRYLKHEFIRNWVRNSGNRYLFDYADIISYNNAGEQNTTTWNDHTFPYIHPDNDAEYDGTGTSIAEGSCHISQEGCIRLAKAMWVLLAKKAGWGRVFALDIITQGNGTVIKSPDKVSYELGEIVTLQANPDPGYVFDHWSGDLAGVVNPITITMDSDKYVTAYFRAIDTKAPSILSVRCYINSLEIIFDEILNQQSAEKISNYSISHDVSITSATLNQDPYVVTLATSTHDEGIIYTLTVTNVEDVIGNPMQEETIDYEYDDGLVGYWSFYEGIGLKTLDLSGNGNDGIISGAVWFEGRCGKALQFDGIDDYVNCGSGAALNISGEGAFAAWIKIDNPEQSDSMKIMSSKNASDATVGYELEYNPGLNYLSISGGGSNVGSAQNVDLDTSWHHVVAVIKGTTAELYLDSYNRTTDTTVGPLVSSGYPLQIGRQSLGGDYFKGLIDEVRVYNRALSEDEVSTIFYEVATDLNGDYKVNKFDWAIFAASWSAKSDSQSWNCLCDFAPSGGDGVVDYRDLAVLCNGWLKVNGAAGKEGIIPVPAPWVSADIGNPNPGSSYYVPVTQTLSVTANGNDIWNQSDNFHFVYQQHSGDCEIIVRLESFPLSVDTWQKAGVMIRDTAAAGSPFVDMVITGGAGNYGSFQWRDLLNGTCGRTDAPVNIGSTPKWVRLVRSGSLFSGYWSNDGTTWTQIGTAHNTAMTDPVLVGMCVTSRNGDNGTKMVTAKFDNLCGDFSFSMFMASCPDPVNGATDVAVDTDLAWVRGDSAIQDEVYLGTDPAALSKVATISAEVLPPLYNPTEDLIASSTYYWQIVETDAALFVHYGPIWNFTSISGQAQVYYPLDGAVIKGDKYPPTGKPTHIYTILDFIPGPTAVTHIGYFSDEYDKVYNRAQEASLGPPPVPSMPNRYYVGLPIIPPVTDSLVKGTTYYWTVDAVDAHGNTFQADVWEFTVQN